MVIHNDPLKDMEVSGLSKDSLDQEDAQNSLKKLRNSITLFSLDH